MTTGSIARSSSNTAAIATALLGVLLVCAAASDARAQVSDTIRNSVVKIYATYRAPNFSTPWAKQPPSEVTGTGFVIDVDGDGDGDRIITNAHVVELSSQIFIQPHNSADRLRADLVAIARGIDLAVLEIRRESDREAFHADRKPLSMRQTVPAVGATIQAIGYPLGGEQQSVTEGVVSRIEYGDYYYETNGLRIQVDAAINPGNSGGPVVLGDEVIGVTFSVIDQAENIGYVIPAEEVKAFLIDIEDGTYHGRPRATLGRLQTAENDAVRDWLDLDADQTGVIFNSSRFDPEGLPLEHRDVIDRIGDYDIDNAGLITIGPDVRVAWSYAVPVLAEANASSDGTPASTVPIQVIRKGRPMSVDLPVSRHRDMLMTYIGNDHPEYFVLGPMVFTPIRRDHVAELYTGYLAMIDSPIGLRASDTKAFEGEEIVAISADLLPHPITKGYAVSYFPSIKAVNGTPIRSLSHMLELIRDSDEEYLVFDFHDVSQETLVFNREELLDSTEEILEDNSIRKQGSDRFMEIWED